MNGAIIGIGGSVLTVMISTLILTFKISRNADEKLERNYKRLDEIKEQNKLDYQSKEVCNVLHKSTDDKLETLKTDIAEIKGDIKTLVGRDG